MTLQVILHNTFALVDKCFNRVHKDSMDPCLKCRRMFMTLHRNIWSKTLVELRKHDECDL